MNEPSAGFTPVRKVATFSWGIYKSPHAKALLGCEELVFWPLHAKDIDAVVGWGLKDNTLRGIAFAHLHSLPFWRLEDGFLRSIGLGVDGDTSLSMVIDQEGMYYDARGSSRLERILLSDNRELEDKALLERAESAMLQIRKHGLSKYNNAPLDAEPLTSESSQKRILVIDQTAGDLSVTCGLAKENSFAKMLDAALCENPEAEVFVKTHPDVLSGKKKGYFGRLQNQGRIQYLTDAINPIALLEQVDKVYVVSSQMGFEALMLGKEVVCFGAPFYAGWGLTEDRCQVARRNKSRSLSEVFAAAYILYSRYVDPDTGGSCEIERVIEHFVLQREQFSRNRGRLFCFGFRIWKHGYVRAYLKCPGNEVLFPKDADHARELGFNSESRLVVWGQKHSQEILDLAQTHKVAIWRMEDGFLRSVGLGSDMTTPASLVVDRQGIYYDPRSPSELESILQNDTFDAASVKAAKNLREQILDTGLSKYNLGHQNRGLPISPGKRLVVLVPGQVEDDASIQLGCLDVATNLGLLRQARSACPDAYIIFKPHPDVLSGNRVGNVEKEVALGVCDHIEEDASLAQCLAVANQVHVMTSLVGFEALLRGLEVHVYGQPFYAGWGLTVDKHPHPRRTRTLSLDQLVTGTYIKYPRYLNRDTLGFTSACQVVTQLEKERAQGGQKLKVSWPHRQLRKLSHIAKELRRGS